MSENLNVNVLVEAKKEYTTQLIKAIQFDIYDVLLEIYDDSQKNNGRRTVSYSNFQKELKEVPNWASFKLESKISNLTKKHPYLMDLITAIFVSHVKILSCVRLKSDNKSIKIKVPSLNTFLHKLIIKSCETIYYKPWIIHGDKHIIIEIIRISVEDTITNQIPIEYILNEYLSGAFNNDDNSFDIENKKEEKEEKEESEESDFEENESLPDSEQTDDLKNIPIVPIKQPAPLFNFGQPQPVNPTPVVNPVPVFNFGQPPQPVNSWPNLQSTEPKAESKDIKSSKHGIKANEIEDSSGSDYSDDSED
jgi:hypothetical protein